MILAAPVIAVACSVTGDCDPHWILAGLAAFGTAVLLSLALPRMKR